ncbi:hypothetical protein MD484_g7747, partial [Candolleomyces efflorescens]
MKKLAIVEEREEDKYDTTTTLKCWKCDPVKGLELPGAETHAKALVDGVMHSLSSARQSEVKAWEEEITPCEHTLMLEQFETGHIAQSENLWLCLTCGSLGCGRQQYGGLGGNGHGLKHFEDTGHAVSVKLGTITAEGEAGTCVVFVSLHPFIHSSLPQLPPPYPPDIYCYKCNDAKQDPSLSTHLSTFGINVQTLSKTEKSMTELQIEHNLRYDFSLVSEDGKALEPVFGKGLTGLANLGNSCYLASVLQVLFSLRAFRERYAGEEKGKGTGHAEECEVALPAECVECQMRKVGDGLRLQCTQCKKVRYRTDESDVVSLGVPATPLPDKDADGKTLYEELVNWVPAKLDIPIILPPNDTLHFTAAHLGTGIQPGEVELPSSSSSSSSSLSPSSSDNNNNNDNDNGGGVPKFNEDALNQLMGMGFPLVRCQKALLATGNSGDVESAMEWLFGHMDDADIDDPIQFTAAAGGGGGGKGEPSAEQVGMLADMGFTHAQARKALRETNGDAERAVEWLFSHPDDTGEDAAPTSAPSSASETKKELHGTKDVPVAYRLKAFISHKGPSVHSGHYVAHVRVSANGVGDHRASYQEGAQAGEGGEGGRGGEEEEWVLFNDEKVVRADGQSVEELKKFAYLYVFERV